MKKKINKCLSIALIISIMICSMSVQKSNICAMEMNDEIEIADEIVVDGVEYSISLDEDGNIFVNGEGEGNSVELLLNQEGEADVTVENNGETEKVEYLVENLSEDDVDVKVIEDGKVVDEYNSFEDIIEDEYVGQAAVTSEVFLVAGAVTLLVLLYCSCIIVRDKKTYVLSTTFRDAVSSATTKVRDEFKRMWFPAIIVDHSVYILPTGKTLASAHNYLINGVNVYSFTSSLAKAAITYNSSLLPIIHSSNGNIFATGSGEYHTKNCSKKYVYRHYHMGYPGSYLQYNSAHSLYGAPIYVK